MDLKAVKINIGNGQTKTLSLNNSCCYHARTYEKNPSLHILCFGPVLANISLGGVSSVHRNIGYI